ncbi:MAG: hypothetical protein WC719_04670 [Patescibacteria group bacterium]|jgi:hypothetical protein
MKEIIKPERIEVLKYLILHSKDAPWEAKNACVALIEASAGMTKSVFITTYSEKVAYGIEDMNCAFHGTHLNKLMELMGADFKFSHHDGYFSEPGKFQVGLCHGEEFTHTIWLSPILFDDAAEKVKLAEIKTTESPKSQKVMSVRGMRMFSGILLILALVAVFIIIWEPSSSRIFYFLMIGLASVIAIAEFILNRLYKKLKREQPFKFLHWIWLAVSLIYLLRLCGLF